MTKFELVISGLAAISIIGLIILLALGKDVSVLTPIVTALVSFVLGIKKDALVGVLRRK